MKFLIGLIVGLLILPVAIALYALSGRMPVATSDSPMPFEGLLAGGGLNSRISREAPTREVSSFGTFELVSGADIYQKNCAVCHGLPGQTLGPVAQGEFPRPPQLFTADGHAGVSCDAHGHADVAGDGAGGTGRQTAAGGDGGAEASTSGGPY